MIKDLEVLVGKHVHQLWFNLNGQSDIVYEAFL